MKILVLFHNIGGYHAARLRSTKEEFSRLGWELTGVQEVGISHEHPWGDLSNEITFPLLTLLSDREISEFSDDKSKANLAAKRLPQYLNYLKPDIVVIPGWGFPVSRAALRWAKCNLAIAILMSESKWDDEPRTWWKEIVKSQLYVKKFQAALVGGQSHKQYLVKLGLPSESIFLGYDVVDNQCFSHKSEEARLHPHIIRQQYPKIPNVPYFISVSRFIPRKNLLLLIDAFARYREVASDNCSWDLVICGSGEQIDEIRSRIVFFNLESAIHLPGFQSYQDIPYWFGLAKAFIHPALSEQWGLVVNEALASGLPSVVSKDCGCFSELIVEGENGFGFDPRKPEELTNIMLKLSSLDPDPEQMRQSSLKYIKHFEPRAFAVGLRQAIEYSLNPSSANQ